MRVARIRKSARGPPVVGAATAVAAVFWLWLGAPATLVARGAGQFDFAELDANNRATCGRRLVAIGEELPDEDAEDHEAEYKGDDDDDDEYDEYEYDYEYDFLGHDWPPGRKQVALVNGTTAAEGVQRVVAGYSARAGEFPWLAALKVRRRTRKRANSYSHCGGIIIHRNLILTAAHCIMDRENNPPEMVRVFVGLLGWGKQKDDEDEEEEEDEDEDEDEEEDDEGDEDDEDGEEEEGGGDGPTQELRGEAYEAHPQYRANWDRHNRRANDLALIRLAGDIAYGERAQPACLPAAGARAAQKMRASSGCRVAGLGRWSARERAQRVQAMPLVRTECPIKRADQTCFLTPDAKRWPGRPCVGDSGGGLYCPSDTTPGQFVALGVVASGTKMECARGNQAPEYFSDLAIMLADLKEMTESIMN